MVLRLHPQPYRGTTEAQKEKSVGEIKIPDTKRDKAMTARAPQDREEDAPMVSVIMANFNGAAHLAEAIESAQRQTLRNLEILVSDDASTDRSVNIVTAKMAADSRIHLLRSPRNIGPAAA